MTETREQTTVADVQMADASNAGKEVAPAGPRDGPVAAQRQRAQENMLADVEANRGAIAQFLTPFGIDFDFFLAGLRVFLMRQMQTQPDFFTSVTAVSFMESLFRCSKDGLIPDGKEAAIGHFKGSATYMPMRDGFVKVLWRTGMVKDINDGVVTAAEDQADRFEYEEGDRGFVRHRPLMNRKDSDEIVAAYCVVQLTTGGTIREVVMKADLDKIRKMSRSPARSSWGHQMDRKAAIRRIMGKMPRERNLAQLLSHDEANYDLTAVAPARPLQSGVGARLALNGDATRPGFSPGHAEQQTNPLSPAKVAEAIQTVTTPTDDDSDAEGLKGLSQAQDRLDREVAAEPTTLTTAPEKPTADLSAINTAVDAYMDKIATAKTKIKLTALRDANLKLRNALAVADPERAAALDNIWNTRWAEIEAGNA